MAAAAGAEGVWTVVVAGGAGTRTGLRKQYAPLAGRRMLDWALAAVRSGSEGVVLVVPAEVAGQREDGADVVVPGGASRSASVRAGLAAVPSAAEVVAVHDAARPFATPALLRAVVDAVRAGADGAIPGIALADTVKRVDAGTGAVVETVPREDLVAVQTPQAFRATSLRAAHASGAEATDDAGLVEASGGRVVVVPGEAANRKVTTADDLEWAAWIAGRGVA